MIALAITAVALVVTSWSDTAWATDGEAQRDSTTANAVVNGGTISISAGSQVWTPPASEPVTQGAGVTSSTPARTQSSTTRGSNDPSPCTYDVPPPETQALLGSGSLEPGMWVFPVCAGPVLGSPWLTAGQPIWVTNPQAPAAPAPAPAPLPIDPVLLAQQAASELPLPTGGIEMAPPVSAEQLVNVPTWLWLDPGTWQPLSATATAGPVSVEATAIPTEVLWDMGDGHQITCPGPGTPYNAQDPNATTDCSYTWTQSSADQPNGAYEVTATISWSVTWSATGAPGGGNLGPVAGPAAHASVRVAESQGLNTTTS